MSETTRTAVLLMNLGSPDSTAVKDVKKYLNQFLMDERVIDLPLIARALLVRGIIVPFRAAKSAEAYKTIWTDKGSPLVVLTKELQGALQKEIEAPVFIAMRYGSPDVKQALRLMRDQLPYLEEVIVVPLYPHYAMSSYETAVANAKKVHAENHFAFRLRVIKPFYNNPAYIKALSSHIGPWLEKEYDHILFSYHGIPERHIRKSDITHNHCLANGNCCDNNSPAHAFCYRHQVFTTTKMVVEALGIPESKYSVSFQSRLGKGWLQPFTDIRLEEMPAEGIKKLLVVCPAFVSDCLETLEEIAERGKESFMLAGGESYDMIPCLNTNPLWVKAIAGWISDHRNGSKEMLLTAHIKH